jgi:simple sugar transport system permease protein
MAVLVTFIVTSVLILAAKANPFGAYYNLLIVPLSTKFSALEVLVKATPLIFTGMAVTFAFTSGYFNIGAEGQLYAGAVAATWVGISSPTACDRDHPLYDRRGIHCRCCLGLYPCHS